MVHLYLYVEGQTEQEFARTVLAPHLASFDVFLMGAVLAEFSRGKGRVHRGGVIKYGPFRRGLVELMKQHDRPGVVFSTMLDYYKYPTDAPGWAEANKLTDPARRVTALQDALADDTDPRRLIPHLQLHEFEALLFTDPSCLEFTHPGHVSSSIFPTTTRFWRGLRRQSSSASQPFARSARISMRGSRSWKVSRLLSPEPHPERQHP
jgi:Domain of unknown function (DUF4276)